MKEYLVHIEIEDKPNSHELIFHSSTLTVLFLAIDDFRKAISNVQVYNTKIITDAQSILESLSNNFESQLTTVDEQDQHDEEIKNKQTKKDNNNDDDEEEQQEKQAFVSHRRQEPQLKIAFPGAE